MIEPIDAAQRAQVIRETERYVATAEALYRSVFPMPPVDFTLIGASAGMFQVKGAAVRIRYNPWLFARYFDESLASTVPHEVAHLVVHCRFGLHRVKPHGPEWREVMADFGADDSVTGDFDLSGIPSRRHRRFRYACDCTEHELSTRRHNAAQRDEARYACRLCAGELIFLEAN